MLIVDGKLKAYTNIVSYEEKNNTKSDPVFTYASNRFRLANYLRFGLTKATEIDILLSE